MTGAFVKGRAMRVRTAKVTNSSLTSSPFFFFLLLAQPKIFQSLSFIISFLVSQLPLFLLLGSFPTNNPPKNFGRKKENNFSQNSRETNFENCPYLETLINKFIEVEVEWRIFFFFFFFFFFEVGERISLLILFEVYNCYMYNY